MDAFTAIGHAVIALGVVVGSIVTIQQGEINRALEVMIVGGILELLLLIPKLNEEIRARKSST